MHLTFKRQLKGYWLGIFAWLILTCAPVVSALTQSEAGYMRLCTALGAHWVDISAEDIEAVSSQILCTCLISALQTSVVAVPILGGRAFVEANAIVSSLPFDVSLSSQPRAPPL